MYIWNDEKPRTINFLGRNADANQFFKDRLTDRESASFYRIIDVMKRGLTYIG